ncbi:META domain-containing protein [Chitinophaga rhizophila]|uniref:META domain-containing protein n=1 Tax=Chitinophaga rhizophila TaxID=2866212 RepID=A0ABS7GEU3_9BACT|nr:META domain-containing protein [Chitinophaga rhizophila]MBW8686197.1 META domain-containing protein [Chitinophaga rhizophila]
MFIRLTALAMVLLANTCNQKAVKQEIGTIQSKRWSLNSMNGIGQEKSPIWLEFDTTEHRFSGNAGCNKVAGQYELEGNEISFGKVISTRMACMDQKANERESAFLRMLSDRTYTVKFEEQQLQFRDSGRVAMSFTGFKKAAH